MMGSVANATVEPYAKVSLGFAPLAAKTVVCHTLTYFVMGALAYHFLNYQQILNKPDSGMHPSTSMWLLFGPALQVFRGVLFAAVFYPLREVLFGRKYGWLVMSWLLIGVGILGTFGAPAGSLEGFIYTTIPAMEQLRSYLEVVPQALLLSSLLCYWVNRAPKRWLNWTLGVLYAICVLLPLMALLAPTRG